MKKVAYITAIYGGYESTCKLFAEQTIDSDFICFTDNEKIKPNGWKIDCNPYHLSHPSFIDDGTKINSIKNNTHTFNLAKYYKQSWKNIPILKNYEVIVWLDGTINVKNNKCSELIFDNVIKYKILGWNHERRGGVLENEVKDSINFNRYCSTFYFNQHQPYQDVKKQYEQYLKEGYDENYWKKIQRKEGIGENNNLGVWLTCFVAFDNNCDLVTKFLNLWYLQTLEHTTQDQVGFSKVVQDTGLVPYTLPDANIKGSRPHFETDLYFKVQKHGK
jgi:hypothetical protein